MRIKVMRQGHSHIPPGNPYECWIDGGSSLNITPKVTPASRSNKFAAKSFILEGARLGEHAV